MDKKILGIDIGSVSVSLAVIDEDNPTGDRAGNLSERAVYNPESDHITDPADNRIVHTAYAFHKGDTARCLADLLENTDLSKIKSIGYTSSTPEILKYGTKTDSRIAYITAAKLLHPDVNSLLIIGAEKFGLVSFNEKGEYQNYKSNTSCAAGTGSFLDQQAERLNLENIQKFSAMAFTNKGDIPMIASRCAVFAKTDLIHAQQEGYSLEEICDGMCYGLAKNIAYTAFINSAGKSVIAAGGVALNKAVIKHLEKLTGLPFLVDKYANVYGAIGAALNCKEGSFHGDNQITDARDIIEPEKKEKKSYYTPLKLKLSDYPDFESHEKYEFNSAYFPEMKPVEIDLYSEPDKNSIVSLFLGIDIGSTSTKAVLLDKNREVIAGLYTRTSGQPLHAVQVIFEAIHNLEAIIQTRFNIIGAGTTGSGRKFAGKILGADIIFDEITAHATAAYELNPETDTIFEIGGQDSKFTVMNNGMVTFSVMNNVCAAGTGSFIEEQAKRLECPLNEYSQRTANAKAPLASDRCTVFMERDLNHYLNEGYAPEEILASVLHSIRENYLTKVAVKSQIGRKIFFQGATAKNKSLVAAFEQKLEKPIMVSKFCHLTGALGTALELYNKNPETTKFRGLDLYKKEIPVRSETCPLCSNNCKLKIAEIGNETEAYGFLCGRDYHVNKYVRNSLLPFHLIEKRKELFRFKSAANKKTLTIGIPAGLHLYEEIPFWQKFFDLLSVQTITSETYASPVKDGKNLSGAEFCAPVAAMHGHVDYLMHKVDYIFLPVYLEDPFETKTNNRYCYYTQFVSSVISVHKHFAPGEKILSPILKSAQGEIYVHFEIYRILKSAGLKDISIFNIALAWDRAKKHSRFLLGKWQALYQQETKDSNDFHIMLLGRPYTVLSQFMNNHIPDIIEKNGIKTFYMDMMPLKQEETSKSDELLKSIIWKFASKILYAAEAVAKNKNCYPILVTSFKCSPDSFVTEYFKEIMNSYKKPYLVLQLDEHDSTVGYETRIEAGIRAFRNHHENEKLATDKMTIPKNDKMHHPLQTDHPEQPYHSGQYDHPEQQYLDGQPYHPLQTDHPEQPYHSGQYDHPEQQYLDGQPHHYDQPHYPGKNPSPVKNNNPGSNQKNNPGIDPGNTNVRDHGNNSGNTNVSDHVSDRGNNHGNKNPREEYLRSLISDASAILRTHRIDFKKFSKLLQPTRVPETYFSKSFISHTDKLKNKTLLLPSWDPSVGPLLEAVLKNSGIDARLVCSTNESILRSLSTNTGQCLPLNIIVQDAVEYIESNNLDPSETVLWLVKSDLSCNFSMFPHYAKQLLNNYGKGLEKTPVYLGDTIFYSMSLQTAINAYLAYMFGGYIRKIGCKIRPYEKNHGATNAVIDNAYETLYNVFKNGKSKDKALQQIIHDFEAIETEYADRPKVAIFGDLYVRDNDLMNQNLIKTIEDNGGEVIITPYSEYLKIIAGTITDRIFKEGRYLEYAKMRFLKSLIPLVEEKYNPLFSRLMGTPMNGDRNARKNWLDKFGLNLLHTGESLENILKIHALIQLHPDIALFIQTNPSYCCPSLITEAMTTRIEEITSIPVVTIEYDGTTGFKNEDIIPYLKFGKRNNRK